MGATKIDEAAGVEEGEAGASEIDEEAAGKDVASEDSEIEEGDASIDEDAEEDPDFSSINPVYKVKLKKSVKLIQRNSTKSEVWEKKTGTIGWDCIPAQ